MPKIEYVPKRFRPESIDLITQVNDIIDDYAAQGYNLTLRQVYYQMVARAIIPNNQKAYKNLGALINDARLAGYIDWNAIEDRTRNLRGRSKWTSPREIINSAAYSYHIDYWEEQDNYVECHVEKDALIGIVEQVCNSLDVNYFSCRGYVSQSEMWSTSQRLIARQEEGKNIILLHLGDHDPSGIDMSRDIQARNELFGCYDIHFQRIALNMDQIKLYNPPPNPTKLTDSRAKNYINTFGSDCWELDALEPQIITNLITTHVTMYRDDIIYQRIKAREDDERAKLEALSERWESISDNWDEFLDQF